ncbi:MAG: ABC transporter ATP-binding protein [Candidatus Sulfomarinibacteraceae bacterium]
MPLILDNLSKVVDGEVHIHPVDLRLEPGSFNTLLGRTGAGKTTLLRLMAGLERPSTGRLSMAGKDVTRVPVRRRNVAMVYQQFVNYPSFTVFDNIASPLKVGGVERNEIERRVRQAAETMHLTDQLDRYPAELSGGQQQRVALARALVKGAELLLLDEPLVNLDFKLREELRLELRDLLVDSDAIVVYATAEPQEALILGGNTLVVDKGRVLQEGVAAEVYRRPATIRAAELVSDPPMNIVSGRLDAATMLLGETGPIAKPAHLGRLPDGPYLFGVRPNHVRTRRGVASDIEIRSTVDLAEIDGSETSIHFEVGGAPWVSRQTGVHRMNADEPIRAFIEPGRLFAFDTEGTLMAAPPHVSDGRTV